MSERLKELQRLRAAAQEQVAWLDREIAREQSLPRPARPVENPRIPAAGGARPPSGESTSPLDADKLIERYQTSGGTIKDEVKRGCFIYFFGAMGLLIAGVVIFYLLRRE
ncbi:hypothetical protein ESB00_08810 [Oleiharenicola lentus]|uniref:Uncharacterized protein n=1 Tax=Oleiharenicola lentus TaxID=2508720 RepID=A0A4Q1CAR6_9BACT|nr:hypothetical protein [Oleiharenicola lentus]RXK55962.1 hypothetical protein ESB00_08810 [Oleiharenicola lentus]